MKQLRVPGTLVTLSSSFYVASSCSPPHTTATATPLLSSIPQYLVSIANWNFKILV